MLATRTGQQVKYLSKTIKEKAHLREGRNKQRRSIMYALESIKLRDMALLDTELSPLIECVRSRPCINSSCVEI